MDMDKVKTKRYIASCNNHIPIRETEGRRAEGDE